MKKILVIGSSNIDMVIGVDKLAVVGETVIAKSFERITGGKGANQAYACGMLGADTTFVSVVGNDGLGELICDNMKKAHVDCTNIEAVDNEPTGSAFICINTLGNNSIVVIAGANACCNTLFLESKLPLFEKSDIIILQMEIPHGAVYYSIEQAHKLGKLIILNPAPAPDSIPDNIYTMLDYITPNETELAKLTGMPVDNTKDAELAACYLLKKGVGTVLVTLGSKGALLVTRKGARLFAPPDIKVVDTTAAGDTFNAAFAVAISEGRSPEDAVVFANFASTLAVSKKGAQPSVPSRNEVEDFCTTKKCERGIRHENRSDN